MDNLWKETRIVVLALVAAAIGAAAGSYLWAEHGPVLQRVEASTIAAPNGVSSLEAGFAPIVDRDLPAVVNISSSKMTRTNTDNSPMQMDPFFRQFFGQQFGGRGFKMPEKQYEHSLGSGVIVRADGYILTNNHVVDSATDIRVTLNDKRELKAKVIGTDPNTDIAVLKVDVAGLPVMQLGDSSKMRVGDIVLAMGNPFGLGQTVTMGIVSARGRANLGIEAYEDFIQTDAPINPGNSGGALINTRGELIGINTAILAGNSGGNQGVGFAVPVNLAHNVMDQILEHGKVVRGYLGVLPQDITPAMADALHMKQGSGVLIGDVTSGAPASQAGLQRGDVIEDVNGQKVEDSNQLKLRISMTSPGTTVNLKVLHDGSEKTVPVKLAELPNSGNRAARSEQGAASSALDGVSVDALTRDNAQQFNIPSSVQGVVVTDVADGSPAAQAGLRPGDVIQEVNRGRVANTGDFDQAVRNAKGGTVLLLVKRGDYSQYIAIEAR